MLQPLDTVSPPRRSNRFVNRAGKRYGRLIALEVALKIGREYHWRCICDCGTETVVRGPDLTRLSVKSCGCLRRDMGRVKTLTHGYARRGNKGKAYRTWMGMVGRCNTPSTARYPHYGARGIRVCREWEDDFTKFLSDMGEPPSPRHSIGRMDNNGDYCKSNCRWETSIEQQNNTTRNRCLVFEGISKTVAQWAREKSLTYSCLSGRLNRGWSVDKALRGK